MNYAREVAETVAAEMRIAGYKYVKPPEISFLRRGGHRPVTDGRVLPSGGQHILSFNDAALQTFLAMIQASFNQKIRSDCSCCAEHKRDVGGCHPSCTCECRE